jgi:hypothetical protein
VLVDFITKRACDRIRQQKKCGRAKVQSWRVFTETNAAAHGLIIVAPQSNRLMTTGKWLTFLGLLNCLLPREWQHRFGSVVFSRTFGLFDSRRSDSIGWNARNKKSLA